MRISDKVQSCILWSVILMFSFASSGCATFSASQLPQRSVFSYPNRYEKGDLTVVAEDFYSREECYAYFDTDLTKRYAAPVFFIVSNKGEKEYAIDVSNFRLTAENLTGEIAPMTDDEMGKKITRGAFWRTLGWCMIVPIISIPAVAIGSGVQTSNVNKTARKDVSDKKLSVGSSVYPNDTMRGVIFFDVSKDKARELVKPRIKALFVSSDGKKLEFDIELVN